MRRACVGGVALVLFSLLCTTAASHTFYVTVCQIDHNVETQALEITFKFFTDDLELALREAGNDDLRLIRGTTQDDADAPLLAYLQKKFRLSVNEHSAELLYVGKEVELDTTYVYVEALNTPILSSIALRSSILLELFEDHTTIAHVKTVGMEKSLVLNQDAESGTLEFRQ